MDSEVERHLRQLIFERLADIVADNGVVSRAELERVTAEIEEDVTRILRLVVLVQASVRFSRLLQTLVSPVCAPVSVFPSLAKHSQSHACICWPTAAESWFGTALGMVPEWSQAEA